MRVAVDLFGTERFDRRLVRVAERATNLTPAWHEVIGFLESLEGRQFDTEGAELSGGWAPLAPSTIRQRGTAHPILVESGALRLGLTDSGSADAVREVTPTQLTFGTRTPYARWHHKGTARMPARPLLQLREGHKRGVVKIIQRHVLADG